MRPTRRSLLLGLPPTLVAPLAAPSLRAQPAWPARPVRVVVAFAAGGPADLMARLVAANLERAFGQPFPVDNRAGAGGQIGTEHVAKQPSDGHTLLVTSSAAHGVGPGLYPNQPYDAVRDFTHVGLIASGPIALIVNAASPWRSVAEFVAAARARGTPVPFGSGGTGSLGHLTGELVQRRLGIPMQHVSYRGSAPAQADLLARSIEAISDNLSSHAALIRAGSLRALAVAATERVPSFPEVPSFAEGGHPGLVAAAWFGLAGSPGIPEPVVGRLNTALREMLARPEVRQQIEGMGLQPEGRLSAAAYAAFVAAEVARWREVIQVAGVRLE